MILPKKDLLYTDKTGTTYAFSGISRYRGNGKYKYTATFVNAENGRLKSVHFGHRDYSDYTIHKDKERMKRYLTRHGNSREDWSNLMSRGALSRWILWSKPNFNDALKEYYKQF